MKKIALHIGINKYDREYYGGDIDLAQCVNDAERLYDYSISRGIQPKDAFAYLDKGATIEYFKDFMTDSAKTLKKGDYLLITDSSHGTYDDVRGKRMTAICLYDGIFWDYEFRELLKKFRTGVTVVWMADCCFSESNWRFIREAEPYNGAKSRFYKLRFNEQLKQRDPEYYEKVAGIPATQGDKRNIKCKMFTYSSSNIYQVSYEDDKGGVFTTAVLSALKKEPNLSYYQLWRRTSELIAPNYPQSPVFENVRASQLTGNRFLT